MKPIDLNQIGKITTQETDKIKQKKVENREGKFDEIFENELKNLTGKKMENVNINTIHSQPLLNLNTDVSSILEKKCFEMCDYVTNLMEKLANDASSNKDVKNIISQLNEYSGKLTSLSKDISDPGLKEHIEKTVFLSNIEVEKYIRGDYS